MEYGTTHRKELSAGTHEALDAARRQGYKTVLLIHQKDGCVRSVVSIQEHRRRLERATRSPNVARRRRLRLAEAEG